MNLIRTKVPGASDAGIKAEMYETFHEFFRDSGSWIEPLIVPIVANVQTYDLIPTSGQIIRFGGLVDSNNAPQAALMQTIGVMTLAYPPNSAATWTAYVVKNVVLPTTKDMYPVVPDFVIPVYGHVIIDGLCSKLYGQPNKSYTNDTLQTFHHKKFRDGIAMARVATLKANTYGAQNWRFPQNFHTRSQKSGVSIGNQLGF